MVSTLSSLICFEFTFTYGLRCFNFILLLQLHSFPSATYWRDFCNCIFLPSCHKCIDHECMGLSGGSLFCPVVICVCFGAVPYCFDYCSFAMYSKSRVYDTSNFVLFFLRIDLAIWSLLWFHTNFRIICSSSLKNVIGIWVEFVLNLQIILIVWSF